LSLPERIAQKFLDLAPLSILSAPIDLPAYDLVMVWHPLRENDPVHRWLRGQILAICQTLDAPAVASVTDPASRGRELCPRSEGREVWTALRRHSRPPSVEVD